MNSAQRVLRPENGSHVLRVTFLYVGQGDAAILAVPDGDEYVLVLVDCSRDEERGGIDLVALLQDLLDGADLDLFVNTHPHQDHLSGLKDIVDSGTGVSEVWHSGHVPYERTADYEALVELVEDLGEVRAPRLLGTRDELSLGDVTYNVLAPAAYVCDEIDIEDEDTRRARIHEQCGVIRFCYGDPAACVMITGDADLAAWRDHISGYHGERMPSIVLSAPHHGSRTFFMRSEEDEPCLDALETISPTYVVVSAPTSEESPHDHPHEKAMELYVGQVGEEGLLHLGARRECVVVDIWPDGQVHVSTDAGDLATEYGFSSGDPDGSRGKGAASLGAGPFITKIDNKPMGG